MCTSYFFNKCALCIPIPMQSSGNNSLNEHISPESAFSLELLQIWSLQKINKGVCAEIAQVNRLEICGGGFTRVHMCEARGQHQMSFSIAFCTIF